MNKIVKLDRSTVYISSDGGNVISVPRNEIDFDVWVGRQVNVFENDGHVIVFPKDSSETDDDSSLIDSIKEENKVFAIISLIIGGIALITSWMPFINNGSAVLSIIAFIIAVVSLLVNMRRKKLLSWIGFIIAAASFAIVLITQASYVATLNEAFGTTSTSNKETSYSSDESNSTSKTYSMGDTIVFEGDEEITITGAEWSDERNQFDDTNPDRVLKVTYNVKNVSDKDKSVGSELSLYVGGSKMDTYPNGGTMSSISSGRTYEGAVEYFGIKGSGDIEVEVTPSWSYDWEPAVVKLDID